MEASVYEASIYASVKGKGSKGTSKGYHQRQGVSRNCYIKKHTHSNLPLWLVSLRIKCWFALHVGGWGPAYK
jgi:hypothetical protein